MGNKLSDHQLKERFDIKDHLPGNSVSELIELNNTFRKENDDLKKTNKELKSILENIEEILYSVDMVSLRIVQISAACVKVYGYTSAEFLADRDLWQKLILPEDIDRVLGYFKELYNGNQIITQYRILHKDKTIRWLESKIIPALDEEGQLIRLDGVTNDITERKQAEKELEESVSLLEATIESTADGILVADYNGKIVRFNKKFIELTGIPQEIMDTRDDGTAISFILDQLINPGEFLSKVKELYGQHTKVSFDILEFKDGRIFERYSQPQVINGKCVGRVWSFRDITTGKQAKDKIIENELRYRSLFEEATEAICISDASLTFYDMNPSGCRMLGYSKEEFLNLTVADLFFIEDLMLNPFRIEDLLAGKAIRSDRRFKRKDGTTIEVDLSGKLMADGRFIMFGRDISERKKAEKLIRESELCYRSLIEQATDAICIADRNMKIIDINPRGCEMLGYSKEEFLAFSFTDLFLPEDLKLNPFKISELQTGKIIINDRRFIRKDGELLDVEISARILEDGRFIIFGHDISERRKADTILKESEKQLSIASRIAKLGYWEFDVASNVFTFNDQFYSIFKTTAEKVGGYIMTPDRYAELFVHPEDRNIVCAEIKQSAKMPNVQLSGLVEYRIIYADGETGWVSVNYNLVINKDGGIIKSYGVNQDITEKKRVELQAEFDRINQDALINNTTDLMWSVDKNYKLINFNQPFFEIIRLVSGKALAKGDDVFSVVLSPDQRGRFTASYARALSGDTFTEIEHIPFPVDSWSEISYYPIRKDTEIIGTACHSRDITERKKAEVSLEKSEKRFRQIVETAQEGIWMIDENNKTTFVNKKMCEILEYSETEMIGRTNLSFKDAEEKKKALQQIERRKKGLKEIHEARFITKTGRNIWVLVSTNAILGADGSYSGALAMMTDITERKESEDKIKESEAKYRSFFEYSTDGILLVTKEGKILSANPAACLIFGKNEAELCLAGRLGVLDTTDPRAKLFVEERERTGKATGTITLLRKGGEKFQAEVSASVFKDVNGEEKTSLIIRDISDKKALEDLLDKASRLAKLGSWEVDLVKGSTYWSDMTREIHEVETVFISSLENGINFYKEGESRNLISQKIQDGIEKGIPWDVELQIITAMGNEKWIRTAGEVEFVDGKAVKINGSFQDITERKLSDIQVHELNANLQKQSKELAFQNEEKEKNSAELTLANKELEQFAYVASHDLQEPLRTTSSFVNLLQQQYKGKLDERADKYLHYISESSDRMKVLITDLLDYSRIGNQKDLQQVDSNIVVHEVLQDLGVVIGETGAKIKVDRLPVLGAYKTELKQLFQNLVVNAIKFRKKDTVPEISISALKDKNCWTFAVRDNGIGIEVDHKERIFVIFQRLHTRTEYEGSGIGLAHCKKIVGLHGGNIWVESTPGEGATFHFNIPENNNS